MAVLSAATPSSGIRGLLAMSSHHWRLLALLVTLQIVDGFDMLAMGFAGGAIQRDMLLSPGQLGFAFSAGQIGSLIGALAVGYLAVRFGRKQILVTATAIVALSSLATALAPSFPILLASRIVTGIGLGMILPLIVGYGSEFFSSSLRGTATALILGALHVGQILGGGVAALVIPRFGWESVFLIGSLAPFALLLFIVRLPASPADLLRRGAQEASIAAVCERYSIPLPVAPAQDRSMATLIPVRQIIAGGRGMIFMIVLTSCLLAGISAYFMNTWTVVLLEGRGFPLAVAVLCLSFYHGGATLGTVVIGWAMDKASPYLVLPAVFFAAVPLLILLPFVPLYASIVLGFSFLIGMFLSGGMISLMTFSALAFPNEVRVHVLASIVILGRGAGILAPIGGGFILAAGAPHYLLFLIAGLLVAMAAFIVLLGRLISPQSPSAANFGNL